MSWRDVGCIEGFASKCIDCIHWKSSFASVEIIDNIFGMFSSIRMEASMSSRLLICLQIRKCSLPPPIFEALCFSS